jgi:hypothetical protein
MFKQHTPTQLHKVYKNYYCGMCFAMQYNYGHLSRYLISYDLMIIGLLLKSHEEPECEKLQCFGQKNKKQQFSSDKWKKIAAINILLTAGQLRDNIEDENSLIAKIFFWVFAMKMNKAKECFPKVYSHITTGYDRMLAGEKSGKSIIEISSEFSILMENVYRCIQTDSTACENTVAYIKAVAGWLYFIDQLDDYDKDVKRGRMNPLVRSGISGIEYTDKHFYEILGYIRHYYEKIRNAAAVLSQSCVEDEILQNILLTTIPSMTAKVLKRSKVPNLKHFRKGTVWSNI